jgi:DNA processing protein
MPMKTDFPIQQCDPLLLFPHLAEIPHPPGRLWLRGSLPAPPQPHTKLLAVVGSRALTRYGREVCEQLIASLSGYPISIVSGLALGADGVAHRAALTAGLHTIAIPGSGLLDTVISPRTNYGLARAILDAGGALVSEQEPDHSAHPYDFPSRNRLMVGVADAVLIIEAGPRSGTLITARLAGEYNRELLCVPHRVGDPHGYGAHLFLRLGATQVTESAHILEALRITPRDETAQTLAHLQRLLPTLSPLERNVYDILAEPQARDELIRRIEGAPSQVLLTLISLELKGLLRESGGLWKRT